MNRDMLQYSTGCTAQTLRLVDKVAGESEMSIFYELFIYQQNYLVFWGALI